MLLRSRLQKSSSAHSQQESPICREQSLPIASHHIYSRSCHRAASLQIFPETEAEIAPCLQPLMTAALHIADTDFSSPYPESAPLTPDKMSTCLINTSDLPPALSAAFCTQFRCSLPKLTVNL